MSALDGDKYRWCLDLYILAPLLGVKSSLSTQLNRVIMSRLGRNRALVPGVW